MNKFYIVLAVLISVNLTTPDFVKADGALKGVEISTGKNLKRKLNISGTITRRYSWSFEIRGYSNSDYTVLMAIDSEQHNTISNYNMENRHGWSNFRSIVQESTKALWKLVDEFRKVIPPGWSEERKVNFVLAFVQSLPYTEDVTTGYNEFYKYAIETLFDGGGDCEDTSILFASILSGLGFEVALIIPPGHLAVGVKGDFRGAVVSYKNNNYYYCETTGTGWKLGQVPDDYKGERVEIMPITPARLPPKQVNPWSKPPIPPRPNPSPIRLSKGINQFETARSYEKAIESFKYVLNQNGLSSKQRVLAHLYWGCSELGLTNRTEPNYNYYVRKAKEQFSQVFRHEPYQELPSRLDSKKKIRTLFEEVRKESIGVLTVTASPPQAEIWIYGNGIKRKKLGVGTVRGVRLFKGSYTVEGIYEGISQKENVKIEPNRDELLELKIAYKQRIVKHKPPPPVSAGEKIPLAFDIISSEKPKQVNIYYGKAGEQRSIYKVPDDRVEYPSHLQTDEVKWIYKVKLREQNSVGKFEYKIKVEYENFPPIASPELEGDYHRIDIVDEAAPIVRLIKPRNNAIFNVNQRFIISAEVTDNTSVKEGKVLVRFLSSHKQFSLEKKDDDKYTGEFWAEEAGVIQYYLTAIDEAENLGKSEVRHLKIVEPLELTLLEPRDGATFNVNQTITIKAEVTGASVEAVRLFYGFSKSSRVEPTYDNDQVLTGISSGIYVGSIFKGEPGYIWYYVTVTDEGGKRGESEVRHLKIVEPLEFVILEPRNSATFNVNQTITIEAEVTGASVESVRLFYGFSKSSRVEPTYDDDQVLTVTSSGIYVGSIFESEPGYIWYYVTAIDERGKQGKSEKRWLKIVGPREPRDPPPPPPPPKPGLARHQGIWASVSADNASTFDLDSDKMLRIAYLHEGKTHPTVGAQLDFSYPDHTDVSTMFQFGPALGKSKFALPLLVGIAEYEDSPRSTHTTPILGAGLKFYPWDNIAIDATTSIKDSSNHDTTALYHYEIGARVYITRLLNLRVGYGKLYLGNRDLTTLQIGLGYTFSNFLSAGRI